MALRRAGDMAPRVPEGTYVDESAILIGDVSIGKGCSVWPCVLMRADDGSIEVGEGSAIMDMAFVEAPKDRPVTIGPGCLVSHCARLHGCSLEGRSVVGIGAIVLDGASVGDGAVVAAGAVVPPGAEVRPGTMVAGVPAKPVRDVTGEELEWLEHELEVIAAKATRYAGRPGIR